MGIDPLEQNRSLREGPEPKKETTRPPEDSAEARKSLASQARGWLTTKP